MSSIDQLVNAAHLFNGYRLIEDSTMTQTKLVPIERNWFMRGVAKVFKLKKNNVITEPLPTFYLCHDCIIAHPENIKRVQEAIELHKKNFKPTSVSVY